MGFAGALVDNRRSISSNHVGRPPPGQPHQLPLVAAVRQERLREGVTELVWMDMADTGGFGPPLEHLRDSGLMQPTTLAYPEPGLVSV